MFHSNSHIWLEDEAGGTLRISPTGLKRQHAYTPVNTTSQTKAFCLILLDDLSGSERARIEKHSHNYKQFLRLHAALERAEALHARILLD
jgi:hypothetical protein